MNLLYDPWPWYISGPIIGLTVPALLYLGNKSLGISSTLRQICAATYPANVPFLNYDWKKDSWNLYFAMGILLGGIISASVTGRTYTVDLSAETVEYFNKFGLSNPTGLMPGELYNWEALLTWKGFLLMIVGGFFVGFGTRYAGGCTSGHGILGLASLQWPSLLATASFFVGGILFSRFVLPYILSL